MRRELLAIAKSCQVVLRLSASSKLAVGNVIDTRQLIALTKKLDFCCFDLGDSASSLEVDCSVDLKPAIFPDFADFTNTDVLLCLARDKTLQIIPCQTMFDPKNGTTVVSINSSKMPLY